MRKARCDKECLECKHGMCVHDQDEVLAAIEEYKHKKKLETSRKWNAEHREYNRQRAKAWYEANSERHRKNVLERYYAKKQEGLSLHESN